MAFAGPVEKDGFSYAGDSLYCQSSNLNRHRRATLPELKAHFNGKDKEDRPAHWYEAQLIHYGLPPSKVKGTAHKRLFDAVKKGGLNVPANITKIENDLKKMWAKREREAKKVLKESTAASTPAKGTKRKAPRAPTPATVTYNIYNSGSFSIQNAEPPAKRAKASKPAPAKATPKKKNEPKAPKTTKASTAPKSSTKATSQRAGPSRPVTAAASSSRSVDRGYDEPPPPYTTFNRNETPASSSYGASSQQPGSRPKLGLLNGRYEVSCPEIKDRYPEYMDDMSLIVTIDDQKLWVKFNFGVVAGMMSLPRPWEASGERHIISWRGYAGESYMDEEHYDVVADYRDLDRNHLIFLGNGHIRGSIGPDGDDEISFDAFRLPDQGTSSEVTRAQARDDWGQLSQDFW